MRIWILSNVAFYMANNLHALFGYRFRMMITRTGKSLRIYFMDVNNGIPNEVISIRAEKGNDGIRLWLNQKYFNFFELSPNKQLEFVRFLISDFCDCVHLAMKCFGIQAIFTKLFRNVFG